MTTAALLLLSALASMPPGSAPVPWESLPAMLRGKVAVVTLDSKVKVEGPILEVTPTSITLDVERVHAPRRTSRPPKGAQTFPRDSVLTLGYRERTEQGFFTGLVAGLFGGGVIAVAVPPPAGSVLALVWITTSIISGRQADDSVTPVLLEARP